MVMGVCVRLASIGSILRTTFTMAVSLRQLGLFLFPAIAIETSAFNARRSSDQKSGDTSQ